MADEKYVDPHHRIPSDQWAQVVRDAEQFRLEHEAEKEE